MAQPHSWKWLAPRLDADRLRDGARAAAAAPARPCMPVVESLGDRLMFSVGGGEVIISPENPAPTSGDVLLGLLRGQLTDPGALVKHQLDVMNALGDFAHKHGSQVKYGEFRVLTQDLIKVNDVLFKHVGDVISGRTTALNKIQAQLDETLLKINTFADAVDDGSTESKLDVAVDNFSAAASKLLADVSPQFVKVESDYKLYSKIAAAFGDVTSGLLKISEDAIYKKISTGDQKFLEIKLQDILVTSLKIGDADLKGELKELVEFSGELSSNILAGDDGDGDGGFEGGVTLTDNGDVIA